MKLKKLVLSGFKSFADRTEFDFDSGVSCVVGPNGCGKSNIVDAVKWVLGEQSAKSLRGQEMLDVIFNGSATRKPSAAAEVTLVFDHGDGAATPDAAEEPSPAEPVVSVTRRLYRSGQSDYLINKAPCRLKDIREMFMDTGIGRDAYSLIEQGRVEVFLQASQDERRSIFDEAAGISKYKARKKEALRKLERVEQNLLRLNDIVGEVDKRLRSIKYQAGKARTYQACSERLKELKSLYFLAQYHTLWGCRGDLQRDLDAASDSLATSSARIAQLEAAQSSADVEALELERTGRALQEKIGGLGAQIATCEERAEQIGARVSELGDQIVATARRCEELEARILTCRQAQADRQEEARRLTAVAEDLSRRHEAVRQERQDAELALARLQGSLEDEKAGIIDLLRRTSQLHNEIHGLGLRRENLHTQRARLAGRSEEIDGELKTLLADRARFEARLRDVQEVLEESHRKLNETRQAGQQAADGEQELQAELLAAREQRSAVESRITVLREMQERLEGVGEGVRRVLQAHRDGRLPAIRGMLGQFVQSDTHHAKIVEAALAGMDQCLLADRLDQLQAALPELTEVIGTTDSVEVLCLDRLEPFRTDLDLADCPQAVARVIDWVRFDHWVAPAVWRLLGRTLVVKDLAQAREGAAAAGPGWRFVTQAGEVLQEDGRVRLGAERRSAGVIARRGELAELDDRLAALERRIAELQHQCESARARREHLDQLQHQLRTAIYEATTERVSVGSQRDQADESIRKLQQEQPVVAGDLRDLAAEIEAAVRAEHDAREKADDLERLNAERQAETDRLNGQIEAARRRQDELAGAATELKVSLAATEEKQSALREVLAGLLRQEEQMSQDLAAGRSQVELDRQRRQAAQEALQKTRAEIDRLYQEHTSLTRDAEELAETRKGLEGRIQQIQSELSDYRRQQQEASEKVNQLRLELGETDVRVENLIARADEEMGMKLPEHYASYRHDEQRDWDAVNAEINDLRGKIERLGNVNLDSLAEQDELEKRREFLGTQLADVDASRNQLHDLIRRINRDSRELFLKTFQDVRANFQELFRKLFGGGRADIILLNEEDVLESGIEIIARPPGKETRTLSLLSGGEKTMTALALLFSIFRCRPSPFCLLDEVDAALDEANNDRFNRLVGEFVCQSQFVIITHAKRTMSMANILYGVTMQEPGVSKRISVRFEDAGAKLEEQLQPAAT